MDTPPKKRTLKGWLRAPFRKKDSNPTAQSTPSATPLGTVSKCAIQTAATQPSTLAAVTSPIASLEPNIDAPEPTTEPMRSNIALAPSVPPVGLLSQAEPSGTVPGPPTARESLPEAAGPDPASAPTVTPVVASSQSRANRPQDDHAAHGQLPSVPIVTSVERPQNRSPNINDRPLKLLSTTAKMWNEAIRAFKKEHPNLYAGLERKLNEAGADVDVNHLFDKRILPKSTQEELKEDPKSHEIIQRVKKQALPILTAFKPVAMQAAALDPYKVAPVVCASVFFVIEFCLHLMNPEELNRVLDAFYEGINTINEWISFETNFSRRSSDAIKPDFEKLEADLPELYSLALHLVCDVQADCTSFSGKFTDVTTKWEEKSKRLKTLRASFQARKKVLDEKLIADDNITKVLEWLKSKDDSEPGLDDVKHLVTSDGRHQDSAKWFLDSTKFKNWCDGFQILEDEQACKPRVLWICGSHGTGKTTIFYRALSILKILETGSDSVLSNRALQVVPYVCSARAGESKRPTNTVIIRSVIQKLSFISGCSVAQPAQDFFNEHTRGLQSGIGIDGWKTLLHKLLRESTTTSKVIILVDALDECSSTEEAELFLNVMGDIVDKFPHVHFLCSSQQHIDVSSYIDAYKVDVAAAQTEQDMKAYVNGEIEFRRQSRKEKIKPKNIFFKPEGKDLLDTLRKSLIERANGMFIWVQIWLHILLPIHDSQRTILNRERAMELLKELQDTAVGEATKKLDATYQRLWSFNSINAKGMDDLRIRLFRLVLCSFTPLSPLALTDALRIEMDRDSSYNEDLIAVEDIKRLYSNFLSDTKGVLEFIHDTGRSFVSNMEATEKTTTEEPDKFIFSNRKNHLYATKLYIQVMKAPIHEIWERFNWESVQWDYLNWERWNRPLPPLPDHEEVLQWHDQERLGNIVTYLARWGLRHVIEAAAKISVFDETLTEILDKVVLDPSSSFCFTLVIKHWDILTNSDSGRYEPVPYDNLLLRFSNGGHYLLTPHVLAWLDIIAEDDFTDCQLEALAQDPSTWGYRERRLALLLQKTPGEEIDIFARASPLQIASARGNSAAVRLILIGTSYLYCPDKALEMLLRVKELDRRRNGLTQPIFIAIDSRNANLVETLVRCEIQLNRMRNPELFPATECDQPVAEQWSHSIGLETAFINAAMAFDEDTMCRLLRIARPKDINEARYYERRIIHVAAMNGYLKLTKDLVEVYNADCEAKWGRGHGGLTALTVATKLMERNSWDEGEIEMEIKAGKDRKGVVDYLRSRSGTGAPSQGGVPGG